VAKVSIAITKNCAQEILGKQKIIEVFIQTKSSIVVKLKEASKLGVKIEELYNTEVK